MFRHLKLGLSKLDCLVMEENYNQECDWDGGGERTENSQHVLSNMRFLNGSRCEAVGWEIDNQALGENPQPAARRARDEARQGTHRGVRETRERVTLRNLFFSSCRVGKYSLSGRVFLVHTRKF